MHGWHNHKFDLFLDIFKHVQMPAPMAEIGVFHGASFIPIYGYRNPGYKVLAVDTWAPDDAASVHGNDKSHFDRNIAARVKDTSDLVVLQKNSQDLGYGDYIKAAGDKKLRLFHIAGQHTCDSCWHNIWHAQRALTNDGVIIVDDVFNAEWPGVSEGLHQFLSGACDKSMIPLLIAFGKVVLIHGGCDLNWSLPSPQVTRQWYGNDHCYIYA